MNPIVAISHLVMDTEVLERLKLFALSWVEDQGVELADGDLGVEGGQRSLIGRFLEKKEQTFWESRTPC